jgi:hypothetical protein
MIMYFSVGTTFIFQFKWVLLDLFPDILCFAELTGKSHYTKS